MDLLVSDEVVLSHRYNLNAVDRTLRETTRSDIPFGVNVVLPIDYFCEIFSVVLQGNRSQIVAAYF